MRILSSNRPLVLIAPPRPGGAANIEVLSEPTELPRLGPSTAEQVFGKVRRDPVRLPALPRATPEEVFGAVRSDPAPRVYAEGFTEPVSLIDDVDGPSPGARWLDPPTVYDGSADVRSTRG